MPTRTVPFDDGHLAVSIGAARGRKLEGVTVYQTQDNLSLDIRFEEGFAMELSFDVRFKASARVLRFKGGVQNLLRSLC